MGARSEGLIEGKLTERVIGAFFEVYNQLGYGFLENVYTAALECVLSDCGHGVQREISVPIYFRDRQISVQRVDMVVDEVLIVEVKSTPTLHPSAKRQLYNYLHATRKEVGLLFHFGQQPEFHRVVVSRR